MDLETLGLGLQTTHLVNCWLMLTGLVTTYCNWPPVGGWPELQVVVNYFAPVGDEKFDCYHCPEHWEGAMVAIAGNTGPKTKGVPMDPTTVLVTDLKV